MKNTTAPFLLLAIALAGCSVNVNTSASEKQRYRATERSGSGEQIRLRSGDRGGTTAPLAYPITQTVDQIDLYHGTTVSDPYRWLEDLDSDETAEWVAVQNELTQSYLRRQPHRRMLDRRLTELWNYERISAPSKHGKWYVYTRNDGLQNQSVLYKNTSLHGSGQVLLDPNALSADGTVALAGTSFSKDGRYMSYSLAEAGSDWSDWLVLDTETGENTGDHLQWTKFTGTSWTHDNAGFFYARFPEPSRDSFDSVVKNQKLYYHQLGTDQSADRLVYERPDQPEWGFGGTVTDDGRWVAIDGWQGTERKARYWYVDLEDSSWTVKPILTNFDAKYNFLGNQGTRWFFQTDNSAPTGRVIAIDIENPDPANWDEVVPASSDTIESVQYLNHSLVVKYLHNAANEVKVFGLDGTEQFAFELPGPGTVDSITGEHDTAEAFYTFRSFTMPRASYRVDLSNGSSRVHNAPQVDFSGGDYVTRQVWYTSKDGTKVPMWVTHRRDLEIDGTAPTLLYGYGGFDISITPSFSVPNAVWLELGGIYVVANIRGGGEFGREWHHAGTKLQKQNVFDDFIAAAEHLIHEGYTRSDRLAIQGGSNGGLLVGACVNQRPDLFGAALPAVGVMDMLRFQRFTIGWAWVSDYGSSENPDEFEALLAYSPLHNVRPGVRYPATMVTTGDHDDRVVPSHSFKYAATLQKAQGGPEPILIRIETRAGHGAGKPTSKRIAEAADRLAFLMRELDMTQPTL